MRIAFLDHHLNNYHADVFLQILRNDLSDRDAQVVSAYESDATGEDWCEKNSVRRGSTVAEAMEGVDAAIVLGPDELHVHPRLCAEAIPFGKPLFIDKVLSPNLAQSQEIVRQATEAGVPFLASSALRHAIELDAALAETNGDITGAATRGYGAWNRYGVHTVTMALRIMGPGFERLIDTGIDSVPNVTLDYGDGRRASIQVFDGESPSKTFPWTFALGCRGGYVGGKVAAYHEFYVNQLKAALELFETGKTDMPPEEALDTVAVLELATQSRQDGNVWVSRA